MQTFHAHADYQSSHFNLCEVPDSLYADPRESLGVKWIRPQHTFQVYFSRFLDKELLFYKAQLTTSNGFSVLELLGLL